LRSNPQALQDQSHENADWSLLLVPTRKPFGKAKRDFHTYLYCFNEAANGLMSWYRETINSKSLSTDHYGSIMDATIKKALLIIVAFLYCLWRDELLHVAREKYCTWLRLLATIRAAIPDFGYEPFPSRFRERVSIR
jgi:hypothetical protein